MQKLKLALDDLRVDTFTPGGEAPARGTVAAHYGTAHTEFGNTCSCPESVDGHTCAFTGPGAKMTCCQAAC
jgi:hypothetical protein